MAEFETGACEGAGERIFWILLIAAMGVAAVVTTYLFLSPDLAGFAVSWKQMDFVDTAKYFSRGSGFATGWIHPRVVSFTKDPGNFPDIYAPPLYSMVLGIVFFVLGVGSASIWACNTLLLIGTAVIVFLLARDAFGKGSAVLASILCLSNPVLLVGVIKGSNQILLTFLITCLLYVAYKSQLGTFWGTSLAGGLAALCYLTEYPYWVLILPLALYGGLLGGRDAQKYLLGLVGAFILVSAVWWTRNVVVTGNPLFCLRSYQESFTRTVLPGSGYERSFLSLSENISMVSRNLPGIFTMYGNAVMLLFAATIFWRIKDRRIRIARNLMYSLAAAVVIFVASGHRNWVGDFVQFVPFAALMVSGFIFHLFDLYNISSTQTRCIIGIILVASNCAGGGGADEGMASESLELRHILSPLPSDYVVISEDPFAVSWFGDKRAIGLPATVKDYRRVFEMMRGKVVLYFMPDFPAEVKNQPAFSDWVPIMEVVERGQLPRELGLAHGLDVNGHGYLIY